MSLKLHDETPLINLGCGVCPQEPSFYTFLFFALTINNGEDSMKKIINIVVAIAFSVVTIGCATIMNGTTQSMGISSTPPGAKVSINNSEKGVTPLVTNLSRKDNHTILIQLAGYEKYSATFTRRTSGWVWGDLVFGGLIGLAIDAISGGMYKLTPEQVQATLQNSGAVSIMRKGNLYVAVVLKPDPGWEKIGQLTHKQ